MEAQLSESSVFPSQSYAASFFTKFPTDSRFLKVTHQSFMPVRIIDGKDIEFSLDRYTAGNVILIQDTTLNVRFQIVKADGTSLPDTDKFVAPRNNILHTLFSNVALHVNNVQISTAPDNYCYKAYITNLLSYSLSAKSTHLQLQGYVDDTEGKFDKADPNENVGFGLRNHFFRKDYDETLPYRPDGAVFVGRLYHELSSCETGLPPNTKVRFVLTKNKDSFVLQCAESDKEQYQVKITNIFLTVPIAQLSQNVYDELSYLMSKKEDTKPVTIQFRKFEVMPMSVPKFKQDYQTGDLFVDGDLPCRIVIAFVDANARLGNYHKNPYNFQRKWEIEDQNPGQPLSFEQRIEFLEEILQKLSRNQTDSLTNNQRNLLQSLSTTEREAITAVNQRTTRAASATSAASAASGASASASAIPRHSTIDPNDPNPPTSIPVNLSSEQLSEQFSEMNLEAKIDLLVTKKLEQLFPPKRELITDPKKYVWLTNINVTLNNNLIDQIDDTQTEDECKNSYYRLCQTTGVLNTPFSNGINYENFR